MEGVNMKRRKLVALLMAVLMLLACIPALAETTIDLSYSRYGVSEQVAVVTVG